MTERNFDHLDKIGHRLPVQADAMHLVVTRQDPAWPLMNLAGIAVYHAQKNYHYRIDANESVLPHEEVHNYRTALTQLGRTILEVSAGQPLSGELELLSLKAPSEEATSMFSFGFKRRWRVVDTTGRHDYEQVISIKLGR